MAKVVKILIVLVVLAGAVLGAYAYIRSKDGADDGKFNLALRRVKGRWLIAADMDNSNRR